jgi:hypothetical protein
MCYHPDAMADVLSRTNKGLHRSRKPRTKKHIVEPRTAEEISKSVGVTKRDAALVTKVLLRLGYIREEAPEKAAGAKTAAKKEKKRTSRKG